MITTTTVKSPVAFPTAACRSDTTDIARSDDYMGTTLPGGLQQIRAGRIIETIVTVTTFLYHVYASKNRLYFVRFYAHYYLF